VATPWSGPFCAGLLVDLRAPNAQFRDGTRSGGEGIRKARRSPRRAAPRERSQSPRAVQQSRLEPAKQSLEDHSEMRTPVRVPGTTSTMSTMSILCPRFVDIVDIVEVGRKSKTRPIRIPFARRPRPWPDGGRGRTPCNGRGASKPSRVAPMAGPTRGEPPRTAPPMARWSPMAWVLLEGCTPSRCYDPAQKPA